MYNVDKLQENIHFAGFDEHYLQKLMTGSNITDFGREKESLNGIQNYSIDQYDTCLRAKWFEEVYENASDLPYPVDFSFDNWPTIKVPSCCNMREDKLFLYEGTVVYTRRFICQNNTDNERMFIKIGADNYQASVFINKNLWV